MKRARVGSVDGTGGMGASAVSELEVASPNLSYIERRVEHLDSSRRFSLMERKPAVHVQEVSISRVDDEAIPDEYAYVAQSLQDFMAIREKYTKIPGEFKELETAPEQEMNEMYDSDTKYSPFADLAIEPASEHLCQMKDGVVHVYANAQDLIVNKLCFDFPDANQHFKDLNRLNHLIADGPAKTFCDRRLRLLEARHNLHLLLNDNAEMQAQKSVPHRDFYNVRKVDTHIHLASSMNQKHLLRFIKRKVRNEPDTKVIEQNGKAMTLGEVFSSLNLSTYDLSVDTLDMHADKSLFHRFDKFNLKYNPAGQSHLREIFLKTDNYIKGRYFAELIKEVFADLQASKYQFSEPRVSIYGRSMKEWEKLADWVVNNEVYSPNARWMVQIPRLYNLHKKISPEVDNFQDMLNNIFVPLFEATRNPAAYPNLHKFLSILDGFDCVDDESKIEKRFHKIFPLPKDWDTTVNPPYSYYIYYFHANLFVLNQFRVSKGYNAFQFRPHCGEAGDMEHLCSAYLAANGIAHGLNLRRSPVLQYLYYMSQIGVAMSPLSNNSLFLDYHKNPCPTYFARGLNISISTDDPLQFHFTREPLMEEYSIGAQVWKLTNCDLCELARNSVLQSGFSHKEKSTWLGTKYMREGPEGNDIRKTNVPDIRLKFRYDNMQDEIKFIQRCIDHKNEKSKAPPSPLVSDANKKRPPAASTLTNMAPLPRSRAAAGGSKKKK